MKTFFSKLRDDLLSLSWRQSVLLTLGAIAIYGMFVVCPSPAYDFAAAKGSAFQVFLTYTLMHRMGAGLVASLFHDFTPFWNNSIGLVFLVLAAHLLVVLFRRLNFSVKTSLLLGLLWLSTPFFFNLSIFQHAMPSSPIAFCADALALLAFVELRTQAQSCKSLWLFAAICIAFSTSVYQAHTNLVLTSLLGIVMLRRSTTVKQWFRETLSVAMLMAVGVAIWILVCHGPQLLLKVVGVVIPSSGGAHDTIFWFTGKHTFAENLNSLLVGLLINWGYNAFFIIGLRWALLSILLCGIVGVLLLVRRNLALGMAVLCFMLSIFTFPVLQCSAANLRTHFCLIPLIVFTAALLIQLTKGRKFAHAISLLVVCCAIFSMGHETATLYYYNWKQKKHDAMHMQIIATDLWRQYGLKMEKPVAIIGGWVNAPTCWEDMRPFAELPLLNHPLITYSNLSCDNVPREFLMIARENIGLVANLPPFDSYYRIVKDSKLPSSHPAYPSDGYIFENDGIVIVNLGPNDTQWRTFKFAEYLSPNEQLLMKNLKTDSIIGFLHRKTSWIATLAKRYPWAIEF